MAAKRKSRKKGPEPGSRGLSASEMADAPVAADTDAVIAAAGGAVLGRYRDPLGGKPLLLCALPVDAIDPTPFQRDLSKTHVDRLRGAIDAIDLFLDPVVAVPNADGKLWTPNGHHRLSAMRALGAKSITALVVPDPSVAYRILALNTEKAHNLKEKSLEVIRMARSLAEIGAATEESYALEFEEPSLLTLGACYEKKARFSGSAYHPITKRVDAFLTEPIGEALKVRDSRAARLLEVDELVGEIVKELKERGFDSPYLKNFVVARINPLRRKKSDDDGFDEVLDRMLEKANDFDAEKVKPEQIG